MCMRVEFHQQKNGLSSLTAFSMNLRLASRNSSSTVSMRLMVSGPVFSIFCVPSGIGPAVEHAARPELLLELGILRVVGVLRLLLGVQVIEVAEELVEAVRRGQELVAVAEVVLAELPGHVAERLQDVGDGRVFGLQAEVGAGQPDLGQAGADRRLPGDERRAAGGAALLPVPVGELRSPPWRCGRCWACDTP